MIYRAYVLGDRLVLSEVTSPALIKKMTPDVSRKNHFLSLTARPEESHLTPIVSLLTRFCEGFGLDFGTIDIVKDDQDRYYINLQRAAHLRRELATIDGVSTYFESPSFNEFLVRSEMPVDQLLEALVERGVLGGVAVASDYPELEGGLLIAVTESNPVADLERMVAEVSAIVRSDS